MDRCGVDNLHLVYLNFFKHLFKYTIHEGLPETKKTLIRDYCKNAGFYSYDAAGAIDPRAVHSALPVGAGHTKWVANLWITLTPVELLLGLEGMAQLGVGA